MKRRGPRTEPFGTPWWSGNESDRFSLVLTTKSGDEKYEWIQKRTVLFKPNQDDRRWIRIEWSMVSKATERSRRQRTVFRARLSQDDV